VPCLYHKPGGRQTLNRLQVTYTTWYTRLFREDGGDEMRRDIYDWTQNPWDKNRARRKAGVVLVGVALLVAGMIAFSLVLAWAFRA
jgi:hypothetical protein